MQTRLNWWHKWAIWEVANGIMLMTPMFTFIVYLLMTTMFSIFTLAIKFDCLFLTIFQSFHLFVGFIFDKSAPSEHMFQKTF